eukprot:UN22508
MCGLFSLVAGGSLFSDVCKSVSGVFCKSACILTQLSTQQLILSESTICSISELLLSFFFSDCISWSFWVHCFSSELSLMATSLISIFWLVDIHILSRFLEFLIFKSVIMSIVFLSKFEPIIYFEDQSKNTPVVGFNKKNIKIFNRIPRTPV